jgi:hypothetical protein
LQGRARVVGFAEVRSCSLEKNANRRFAACVLANLMLVRSKLL